MPVMQAMVECIDTRQGLAARLEVFCAEVCSLVNAIVRRRDRRTRQMPKKAAELRKESLAWLPCADAALGVRSVLQQLLAEPPGYKLRGRLRERVKANIMAFGDALVTCH